MKKILLHTFVILISSLILIETIGIYLTKDTCNPCGESEITAQIIITDIDVNSDEHHECEADAHHHNHNVCEQEDQCSHNEQNHEHHQEHYLFKNISVFLSASTTPEFEAQTLTLLAPLVALLLPSKNPLSTNHYNNNDYPKAPQNRTCSMLCTYLI